MPKPAVDVVVALVPLLSRPAEVAVEGLLSIGLDEDGCGAVQQTHLVSDGLFCTKQTSQSQPAGVTCVMFGAVLLVATGGGGEEKLKVGKAAALMGSEMVGRLLEGRVLVLSLFILPPPEVTLLAAGVLDRG
ncbi:hypothetical protein EYF80_028320 [Liparis tanakae]|uniref:Uncharacterized protein n=1 Tax=Liparis tanakae TaxID=230148 RepID=A0A4Z2H747_9TELE|nr:hypothetical protein EYF80_028320 [Liparis tanakae]